MRLLAWWRGWRARRALVAGPHYVQQIQILQAARPMALPAIRPLQAVVIPKAKPKRARKSKPPVAFPRTGTR
jgi:hypothetical protein